MMLAPTPKALARTLALTCALLFAGAMGSLAKDSVYSKSTIVVYNKNFPGSDTVSAHYVTQRSIPSSHRVALDCPQTEEISRTDYRRTIEEPLQRLFTERGWWELEELGTTRRVVSNKIHVIVLAHGVPLKIKDSRPAEALNTLAGKRQSDAASVDSELALLGDFTNQQLSGYAPNPYFRQELPFGDAELHEHLLVGRVDGPTVAACRRMIDEASEVERTGLWGRAYIDLAQKNEAGYKLGEDWLKDIAAQCDREGIASVVDFNDAAFPPYYPMNEAALYFGWYVQTRKANGPFLDPEFRLKKGAVACHIHSFSASTIRSKTDEWVGPMVEKGAAGVLGNVYEPFLSSTTHLDIFFRRLLEGYTLAEAAYMATPHLSWMSVVVGDPLYRPYDGFRTYEPAFFRNDQDAKHKTYHVATKLWSNEAHVYEDKLKNASKHHKTGYYYEAQASRLRNLEGYNQAMKMLTQAKNDYLRPEDKLRIDLQMVDVERQRNNKPRALSLLRTIKDNKSYQDLPGLKSVTALLNQLDPPGPASG